MSADESGRLQSLAEYGLSAEHGLPSLDPIVEMAAKMFDCPAAAVNMIGSDHVFLVSKAGIDDYEKSRDLSFCAHAINQDQVMVVEDAALDPRFHDNPLVEDGFIKFYAGVPLLSPTGHALGALCVIDNEAHGEFSLENRKRLAELAKLAVDRLELRRIEVAADAGSRRLEASAATSPNAIVCFDEQSRITAWNNAAVTMFGRAEVDVLGSSLDRFVSEPDRPLIHGCIARVLSGEGPDDGGTELHCLRRDGAAFPVEIHWSRWREGSEMHFGAIIRDMTEKRRERDALYRLANYDTLTGLPNRNLLAKLITEAYGQGKPMALLINDLDGYADINNTLGQAAGDRVLCLAADRLEAIMPEGQVVGRIGRSEFAALLIGEADPLNVNEVARTINAALSRPFSVEGTEVRIATNCGMALAPDHGDTVEELTASANLALFQARSTGRGGTYMFVPALRAQAVARRMHDAELHRAFERGEFTLFYQPQVRLADGGVVSAEALIRWRHPERGLLAPAAFLPGIEKGVLAEPVGRWVVETACTQVAEWRKLMPDFRIGINLFAAQFRDGHLRQTLLDTLAAHGLTPDALDLEVTENIVLDGDQTVLAQLRELRQAGFRLAFDDFGTGYASLNMLRDFPVTHIKIDQSFTKVMQSSAKDQAIVLALLDLARELGLKVIAEGIESEADRDFLHSRGCAKGQGFHFGRPVPAALFEEQFFTRDADDLARAG